jgi:hypothetical protein
MIFLSPTGAAQLPGARCSRHRSAPCRMTRVLTQIVLTATMQQYQLVEEQMTIFLASAPDLATRLAHWQSDDAKA